MDDFQEQFEELRKKYNLSFQLKDKQKEIIQTILKGYNCIGLLPTGFGKSMCFIVPTLLKVCKY